MFCGESLVSSVTQTRPSCLEARQEDGLRGLFSTLAVCWVSPTTRPGYSRNLLTITTCPPPVNFLWDFSAQHSRIALPELQSMGRGPAMLGFSHDFCRCSYALFDVCSVCLHCCIDLGSRFGRSGSDRRCNSQRCTDWGTDRDFGQDQNAEFGSDFSGRIDDGMGRPNAGGVANSSDRCGESGLG